MRSNPQRYQGLTTLTIALLMLFALGGLVTQPAAAKSLVGSSPALSSVARASLSPRLQITDTTGMTDTMEMTDTMAMTDTAGMTDTMAMTDTMEMTDTTDADAPADDSTDNATAAPAADASSMMTTTDMVAGGSGPESALTPGGEQATLAARERRWYIFKYDYDADAGDPSNVIAELRMEQAGSLSFEVWSDQNLRQWQNGEDFTPTGAGTPAFAIGENSNSSNRDRSLLRWVGGGRATTLYYLIVENNTDAPANYTLTVSGATVSFPGVASSTGMTTTMAMTDTNGMGNTAGMTNATTMGGTSADDAVTPTGQRTTLAPRERRWYTFKYNFNQDDNNDDAVDNDASEAIVELRMAQAGAVSFEVWSQDDVSRWQNGEDFTPTGAGTPAFAIGEGDDDRDRTLLRWVGSGEATVTYYIIVQNNTDETVSYRLTVSGESVSFTAAAMGDEAALDNTAAMTSTTDTMDTSSAMTETMAADSTAAMTATTDMTTTMDVTDTTMSGGAGPENALAINGQRETLAAGAQRWYTFEYAYDPETDSDDSPSNAIVELRMAQSGSLSFEVWSGDNVQQWQNNEDFTPTGAGTPAFAIEEGSNADNRDRALLRWVGSAEASVRYYVIVTNNTDAPATYRLTTSGPDVRP